MLPKLMSSLFNVKCSAGALNSIYYSSIIIALAVTFLLIYNKLLTTDYDKKIVQKFILIAFPLSIIAAYFGTRSANMFYEPVKLWSMTYFFKQMISGKFHTFHAGLVFSTLVLSTVIIAMRFRYLEVLDIFFLYIPIGHAIGRGSCLLVGCCWGRKISITLLNITYKFSNPIPLYTVILLILLFFLLRKIYNKIYSPGENLKYRGLIFAVYLLVYGIIRFVIEIFRKERVIALGLTQAQIVMLFLIIIGSIMLFEIWRRNNVSKIDENLE